VGSDEAVSRPRALKHRRTFRVGPRGMGSGNTKRMTVAAARPLLEVDSLRSAGRCWCRLTRTRVRAQEQAVSRLLETEDVVRKAIRAVRARRGGPDSPLAFEAAWAG
jgi:hypothetical protein